MADDAMDDPYYPSMEEQKEIEEVLNSKEYLSIQGDKKYRNRLYYQFSSEDHWVGWLRTNGIRW